MKAYLVENSIVTNILLVDSIDIMPNLIEATQPASIGWIYDGTSFTNPNHDKENDIITPLKESLRKERNELLSGTDWTQAIDSPLNAEDKTAWATYRQSLRDIPDQSGFPTEVTWPTEPEVQ